MNPGYLPTHRLIKLKRRPGFHCFGFMENHLIKIRFQPVRWCTSWRNSWRCGWFTDINQETLKGIRLSKEGDDL
jgi:hypothetical protein